MEVHSGITSGDSDQRLSAICTVLVIEHLTLVRRVIHRALEREPGITVVGETGSLGEALPQVERLRPTVALLAAGIPGYRPSEAIRLLGERSPDTAVILLAGSPDGGDIVRAVQAGMRGCLTYASSVDDVVNAVRDVHLGGTVIDRIGLNALFDQMSRTGHGGDQASAALKRLTAKERAVLALLAQGASKDDIAADLAISPETVRTHAQRLLNKLGVHSRLEAVAYVNQHDLLPELLAD